MSGKQNKRRRTGRPAQPSGSTAREQKRAQFEQPKSRTGMHLALAGVALVAVAVIAAFVVMNRGGAETATATTAAPRAQADQGNGRSRRTGSLTDG